MSGTKEVQNSGVGRPTAPPHDSKTLMATVFGAWLKGHRAALGLTQQELADRAACSVEAIRKLEAGTRKPSKQVAESLAAGLGIPADEREAFVLFARADAVAGAAYRAPPTGPADRALRTQHAERGPAPAPWRALRPRITNLPSPLTSLIGRDAQVAEIRAQFLDRPVRLLTLTGPPGIGKTRLALAVAAQVLDHFADGVFFVELAPLHDAALVVPTIARTLGLKEQAHQPIAGSLEQHLADKRLFLVLDNFEQVLAAAPAVAALLEKCAWVRVLCTSREALHIRGERPYLVPALPVPDAARTAAGGVRELAAYPAVTLFVDRAQEANPAFALTPATARIAAAIGRRLDGLPLALELVAAHTRGFTPEALLARLESGPGLLGLDVADEGGGYRDLPERQWTIQHAIAWSYDLLDDNERRLFRYMGLFVHGCTAQAIAAVCGSEGDGTPGGAVAPAKGQSDTGVQALVDKSLVTVRRPAAEPEAGGPAGPRYGLLEVIREFARRSLAGAGELDAASARHLRYYTWLAEEGRSRLRGPDQKGWLARLDEEHDNLRAALAWAVERARGPATGGTGSRAAGELALRLAGALGEFWLLRAYYHEGRAHLATALAVGPATGLARAKALHWAGTLAYGQDDYPAARPLLDEALVVARAVGDQAAVAAVLNNLGNVAWAQGDYAAARRFYEETLVLERESGNQGGVARTLSNLGDVAYAQGDLAPARALHEEALALRRDKGLVAGVAAGLHNLGVVVLAQGDYAAARALLAEALARMRELGQPGGEAWTLHNLGLVAAAQGDRPTAETLQAQALAIFRERAVQSGLAATLVALGGLILDQAGGGGDNAARAVRVLAAARALLAVVGGELEPVDRLPYERALAAARAALGETRFAAAWTAGQELPIEDAIALALEAPPGV